MLSFFVLHFQHGSPPPRSPLPLPKDNPCLAFQTLPQLFTLTFPPLSGASFKVWPWSFLVTYRSWLIIFFSAAKLVRTDAITLNPLRSSVRLHLAVFAWYFLPHSFSAISTALYKLNYQWWVTFLSLRMHFVYHDTYLLSPWTKNGRILGKAAARMSPISTGVWRYYNCSSFTQPLRVQTAGTIDSPSVGESTMPYHGVLLISH